MTTVRLLLAAALCAPAWPVRCAPPLEAYGRLPQFEDVALSPDGGKVAYVIPNGNAREVVVQTFGDEKHAVRLNGGEYKLRSLTWMGNEHLAILSSEASGYDFGRQYEFGSTQIYDFPQHELTGLPAWLGKREAAGNSVISGAAPHGVISTMLAEAPQIHVVKGRTYGYLTTWTHGVPAVYRADLERDRADLLQLGPGSGHLTGLLIDKAGEPVAETSYVDTKREWSLEIRHDGQWQQTQVQETEIDQPRIVAFAPEDGWALMHFPDDSVRRFSLTDGSWGERFRPGEYYWNGLLIDPITHKVIGDVRLNPERRYTFYDKADQAAWDKVVQTFPSEDVALVSWTDNRQKLVVRVVGPKTGAVYALLDFTANRMDMVGNYYKGIGAEDIAPVDVFRYPAGDGQSIPAYLTLPTGRPAKNLPLVVLPHGGPEGRDVPGFDWWVQALASRGYAVLQPQFRGSVGFGVKFLAAGYGQWGRKMLTDQSDGVRYLAGKGVIDPKRVCIVGASYGGYAALAGAAIDTGSYRCAVSVAGISDMRELVVWENQNKLRTDDLETRYLDRLIGAENIRDPVYDAISPVKHVDQIKIPLLLIHGTDDSVVPPEQTRYMAEAMQKAGKPYELVTLSGEDHWLSRTETRTQMLKAVVQFLEKNNPP
ncbi:MAG: S9 family peptidase [Nevskia sp.]|nr:S9 family peptidase [Nevskia sp.]